MDKMPFIYCGFWTIPDSFVVESGNRRLLFWREFDEEVEDYRDWYQVFVLPSMTDEQLDAYSPSLRLSASRADGIVRTGEPGAQKLCWIDLRRSLTTEPIAEIPVRKLEFDPTCRKFVGGSELAALLTRTQ